MSEDVDLQAFLSGFVEEAEEHLRACRASIVEIDRGLEDRVAKPRAVRECYRALHTIKGLSGMVGVQPLVDLAHHMETVLREADQSGGSLDARSLDVLARGVGAIESRVAEVRAGMPATSAPKLLLDELEALPPATGIDSQTRGIRLELPPELANKISASERAQIVGGVRAGRRALRLVFMPSPARSALGVTITSIRERVARIAELVRVLPVSVPRSDDAPGGLAFELLVVTDAPDAEIGIDLDAVHPLVTVLEELDGDAAQDGVEVRSASVVRVGVDRLDRALLRLGGAVVTRYGLDRAIDVIAKSGIDVRELKRAAEEHGRQLRWLRESILKLRMIPVAEMLEPLPLIVRGLRTTTGKEVRSEIDVAHTELDKSVAETVFPAIVHLVRNAVDHGIESPQRRRELGKPEHGTLRVRSVELGSGMLELEVSDDGAGVDARAVARSAGLPVPDREEALLALLVRPGLSTRDEANQTSGRGMGMEIVHRVVVQKLGGELRLRTQLGRGTTFVLRVPLTVSIVDGLTFECAEQAFVVPLASIDEIVDSADLRVVSTPDARHTGHPARVVERRGELMTFVSLRDLFTLGGTAPASTKVLVVRRGGRPYALEVDRMIGQQEVVVRPLEDPLVRVAGVTGATDLGDGRPTLVLDPSALATRTIGGVA